MLTPLPTVDKVDPKLKRFKAVNKPTEVAFRALMWFQCLLFAASYSPVIPPRFDNFCEQIVGAWGTPVDSHTLFLGEVEEVMRSCGGAVQGIREVKAIQELCGDSSSSGLYHNRADDGFIYFDCGSYTQGPVQIPIEEEETNEVGSITFSTIPKSRVLFDCSSNISCQILVLGRKKQMLSQAEKQMNAVHPTDEHGIGHQGMIWGKEMICSMPSPNQPWMLQRVKWKQSILDESNIIKSKTKIEPNDMKIKAWFKTWRESEIDVDYDNLGSSSFDNFLKKGILQITQFGAACMDTGEIKCILRCYDEKGMLKGIILQQGKLPDDE